MHYQYIIGIGSNLPAEGYQTPLDTCLAALRKMQLSPVFSGRSMLYIIECSRWYRCPPVPVSDQPWFVNAVFRCVSALPPDQCLLWLHKIEQDFGRVRRTRNEARTLDLDIILHPQGPVDVLRNIPELQVFHSFEELQDTIEHHQVVTPLIPHPRMNDRHFVLYPLQDIYPDFVHPIDQTHIQKLIKNLEPSYEIYPLEEIQSSIGFAK